jgi:hypothetical protein
VPTSFCWNEDRAARFDEAGLEAEQNDDKLTFNSSGPDLAKYHDLIAPVVEEVVSEQIS